LGKQDVLKEPIIKTKQLTALEELLSAREERSLLRLNICEKSGAAVSLNLNIPGIPKLNPVYNQFFQHCIIQLKNWLLANRVIIDHENEMEVEHAAGNFYIAGVKSGEKNTAYLKQITEKFELNHKLGRFIDVDVSDENGNIFSSGKLKECFYCKEHPAIECMRKKRHPIQLLREFQQRQIQTYLREIRLEQLKHKIVSVAIRSVFYELSLTPKPGLVDASGNGVHNDMNFKLFIDSTAVISTYFMHLFLAGYECETAEIKNALPIIRNIGLIMEREMFLQTKGINTQKGIIFLMGISLFSVGHLMKEKDIFDQELFVNTVKTLCLNLVQDEFAVQKGALTHGELCFKNHQIGGVRHEAELGFPSVFLHALPLIEKEQNTDNEVLFRTLLTLMSVVNDTNVLYRSDLQTLSLLQNLSRQVADNFTMKAYAEIISFCRENNISPGGSADLLSITIFIYLLKNEL
jgi:holo-ACP synthase/triphosphoribosyl-dephospho-CoA synthase